MKCKYRKSYTFFSAHKQVKSKKHRFVFFGQACQWFPSLTRLHQEK